MTPTDLAPPRPWRQGTDPQLRGRLDDLATALHGNNERLDGLTDAMVLLRSFVNQRLADVGDAVSRSQTQITQEIIEARSQTSLDLDEAIEEASKEGQAHTARHTEISSGEAHQVAADIANLGDLVADSLTQVADRLERLAVTNANQTDIVDAVAEALDDVAGRLNELDVADRSRHDRLVTAMVDLRSKRGQAPPLDLAPLAGALGRIETTVEAMAYAAGERPDPTDHLDAMAERLEARLTRMVQEVHDATAAAARTLTDAAERAASRLKKAPPGGGAVTLEAAMTRLEARFADMALQREEYDLATQASLTGFEETVRRLAVAQAEDLERILDTVESHTPAAVEAVASLSVADAERLARIEDGLRSLAERPAAAGAADSVTEIGQQVAALSQQIEALRRRMAVRARPAPAALDAGSLELLAEIVANRLRDEPDSPAAPGAQAPNPPTSPRGRARRIRG